MQASAPPLYPQGPTQPTQCLSKVELNISCKNLIDKDVMSKSDPMCVVMLLRNNSWDEVGRTERIENTLNPNFSTAIIIDYFFEELQKLKFMVYDIDSAGGSLKNADFLGEMECTLGQVVSSSTYTQTLKIPSAKKSLSTITITAEEVSGLNSEVHLTFRASKLDKKDFLGKSDPYLEFARTKEDGSFVVVHRTEFVKNNLNPRWKEMTISIQQLCNGDYDRIMKVTCYDWDDDGSHDLIGSFTTNLREMSNISGTSELQWPCINQKKKKKKKSYTNSGIVYLTSCKVIQIPSFLDFIKGGCQLNFTVAIDFTGSNGNPKLPTSLHYMNPYAPNEYMQALTAVGEIIQDYDSDKLFPSFGFGAKIPPERMVSHQFALNFNHTNPYCQGLQGIIQAYQACLPQIEFYGPTNISPIVSNVAMFARTAAQSPQATNYYVLLILTDGVITDMEQVKEAIVEASSLPVSIIIVGVGGADFKMMEELDGDDGLLRSRGRAAQRDIVQFVPYRKFKNYSSVQLSSAALAKEVLAEVPTQLTSYYKTRKILPGQPNVAPPPY